MSKKRLDKGHKCLNLFKSREGGPNIWEAVLKQTYVDEAISPLAVIGGLTACFWYDEAAGIQPETFDALEIRIKKRELVGVKDEV